MENHRLINNRRILQKFGGSVRDAIEYCLLRRERPNHVQQLNLGVSEMDIAIADRRQSEADLAGLSLLDDLTGIPNKYCFDQAIDREYRRARRFSTPLALILIEVDDYNAIQKHYGNQVAGDCLCQVANALNRVLKRTTDLVAHCSIEQFALVLPNTKEQCADQLGKQVMLEIEAIDINNKELKITDQITVSVGIAGIDPKQGDDFPLSELISQANQALNRARKKNHNRLNTLVCISSHQNN